MSAFPSSAGPQLGAQLGTEQEYGTEVSGVGAPIISGQGTMNWFSPVDSLETHDTLCGNWKTPHDTDIENELVQRPDSGVAVPLQQHEGSHAESGSFKPELTTNPEITASTSSSSSSSPGNQPSHNHPKFFIFVNPKSGSKHATKYENHLAGKETLVPLKESPTNYAALYTYNLFHGEPGDRPGFQHLKKECVVLEEMKKSLNKKGEKGGAGNDVDKILDVKSSTATEGERSSSASSSNGFSKEEVGGIGKQNVELEEIDLNVEEEVVAGEQEEQEGADALVEGVKQSEEKQAETRETEAGEELVRVVIVGGDGTIAW